MNSLKIHVVSVTVLFASAFSSCALAGHEHPHEHSHGQSQLEAEVSSGSLSSARAGAAHFSGRVVDEAGDPVRAKVSLVRPTGGGSYSMTTSDDGRFNFQQLRNDVSNVTVATDSGLIAVFPARSTEAHNVELLVAEQGGLFDVGVVGEKSARMSVIHNDIIVYDFTLRPNRPEVIAIPVGEVTVKVYGEGIDQTRELNLSRGQEQTVRFDLGSNG